LGAGSVWVPNREDCGVRSSDRGKELWLRHVTVRGEEVHIRVLVAPRGAKWPGAKGRSARRKPKWLIAAPLARGAQGAGANKAGRGTADRRGFGHGGQKSYVEVLVPTFWLPSPLLSSPSALRPSPLPSALPFFPGPRGAPLLPPEGLGFLSSVPPLFFFCWPSGGPGTRRPWRTARVRRCAPGNAQARSSLASGPSFPRFSRSPCPGRTRGQCTSQCTPLV